MDRIAVSVGPSKRSENHHQVLIEINGESLFDLAQNIERPFADAEGSPSIAGAYAGLSSSEVMPPSRHFLGESHQHHSHDDGLAVLDCECGFPGCWPLVCQIDVDDTTVTWHSFLQPHRKDKWNHDGLGPFVFDQQQYKQAFGFDEA